MATWFKRKVIRPIRNRIINFILKIFFFLAPLSPRKLLLWWNKKLSKFICLLSRKQRKIMYDNFSKILGPERFKGQYRNLSFKIFQNLALTFTDYIIWNKKKDWNFFSKYFTIKGENYLREAYKRGKGVLCLVTHTPGWEFSAFMPPQLGYKSAGVSSKIKNPALNQLMINLRETRGMRNITRNKCYDELVQLLNNGECLIIMTDQDSLHIKGEFIEFMGFPAYTPIGCSRLACDTGAAIIPMYTIRNNDDTYTFVIEPELKPYYNKEGIYDIIENTRIQNDAISRIIFNHPDQWVWMHQRWKNNPETLRIYLEKRARGER
ncbi:MAG: lysophospholipid acyltransferase family protein [Bacteroidales bacterium]|nr:lysophospholipid acyltransferase family protein [Bacteroidales bacterium]